MNERLSLLNSQIEEQQRILDELNHKVMLKENQLGISKIKELNLKLETAQKQVKDLSQRIEEKNKIILDLKEEIKKINKIPKDIERKFNNLHIENNLNEITIIGLLLSNKNLDETINTANIMNTTNLNLEEENRLLKSKITRMKNAINELSSKLEKELLIKEQKNLKINENNSKLFDELQKKSKDLARKLKLESMNLMALKKEKYDLETICIKQEECIRKLKKKINYSRTNIRRSEVFFSKSNILPQNIHIIGNNQKMGQNINKPQIQQGNDSQNISSILPRIK